MKRLIFYYNWLLRFSLPHMLRAMIVAFGISLVFLEKFLMLLGLGLQ